MKRTNSIDLLTLVGQRTVGVLSALLSAGCVFGGETQPTGPAEAKAASAVETALRPVPQPDADERHVILSLRFGAEKQDATLDEVRLAYGARAQTPESPADALVALVDRDGRIVAELGVPDPFVARAYETREGALHTTPKLDEHPLWLAVPLAPGAVEVRWQDVRSHRTLAWPIAEALEQQCAGDASAACRAYLERR
jgi:hypothetical protein